jgi:hypothetical protein
VRVALVALGVLALGREPALELHHDAVDRGQVLRGAARERAVELVQRPRGRQRLGALDLRAFELAAQMRLEAADLLAGQRQLLLRALALDQPGRLGLQAEGAPDPLDIDAQHARALAAAAEGGDRQPREVGEGGLVPGADRFEDLLAQRVEVDPVAGLGAALLGVALADPGLDRGALGGAEEIAVEDEVEDAPVVGGLGQRRRQRLLERARAGPFDLAERGERVVELGRADRDAFASQSVGEPDDLGVKRQAARPRVRPRCRDRCGA